MKKRVMVLAAVISGALAVSGCTTNPYTGEREAGSSGLGAGIGSLVGAGVGALSSSKKDRGKGALIGAAAGAALGGGVGYYMDVQEAKLRDKMQGTGVSVTRNGDNIVLNMPNNVTFDSNQANLKPAGANTLTGVAMVLKEYPKTAVNVLRRNYPLPDSVSRCAGWPGAKSVILLPPLASLSGGKQGKSGAQRYRGNDDSIHDARNHQRCGKSGKNR